jgi:excisionase family DNA binding protein
MSDAIRWLKVGEAADRARCGPKTIYRAVQRGQLRAARIGGRRELRFLASWIDCWLAGEETEQPGGGLAAGRQVGPRFDADTATRIGSDWR